MKYLYPNQVIFLHKQIISAIGGFYGVRKKSLLESAVYRPQASFGGQELYPDLFLKVSVLGHSIISNNPFCNGNRRVCYEAMRLMLRWNGYDIKASLKDKFKFVMSIAEGDRNVQSIATWIRNHSVKLL